MTSKKHFKKFRMPRDKCNRFVLTKDEYFSLRANWFVQFIKSM